MKRNLVSVACLVKKYFVFSIDCEGIKISHGSNYIGSASFMNDYWLLTSYYPKEVLLIENSETTVCLTGNKRKFNENFAYLWHMRLGHVSKERMQFLVKQNVLPTLDFSDLTYCIECIKGKFVKKKKKTTVRSTGLLNLIHTDICGPFKETISGCRYFVTFIDDHSR